MVIASRRPDVVSRIDFASIWRSGLVAAIVATLVNGAAYVGLDRVADVPFEVTGGEQGVRTLSAVMILGATFGAVVVATVALRLLSSIGKYGITVWALAVHAGFLVSLAYPITSAEGASTMWSLIGMQTVVAAAAIFGPGKASRRGGS